MKSPTEDCPPLNAEDSSGKGCVTWAIIPKLSWWRLMTFWTTSAYWQPWRSGQHRLELLYFRPHAGRKPYWLELGMQKASFRENLNFSSSVSGSHSCWVLSAPQFPHPIKQNSSWEGKQAGQTNCKVLHFHWYVSTCPDTDLQILLWYLVGYSTVKGYREETKVTTQRNREHDIWWGSPSIIQNFMSRF